MNQSKFLTYKINIKHFKLRMGFYRDYDESSMEIFFDELNDDLYSDEIELLDNGVTNGTRIFTFEIFN